MDRPTLSADGGMLYVPDGRSIPWDAANNRPLDHVGSAGRAWDALKAQYGMVAPDSYTAPPVNLTDYAADKRWQKEVGGTTINGIPVPTDDRAKLLILGAAQTLGDNDTAPFISSGVNYGTLTGAQFKAINAGIVAHVQATFATLATVLAGIADNSITSTAEIDAAFAA